MKFITTLFALSYRHESLLENLCSRVRPPYILISETKQGIQIEFEIWGVQPKELVESDSDVYQI